MKKFSLSLLIALTLSANSLANTCQFVVSMRPQFYSVSQYAPEGEMAYDFTGVVESAYYFMNGVRKDLQLEGKQLSLTMPNFNGLVEIVHEAMKPTKFLHARIHWDGVCESDPVTRPTFTVDGQRSGDCNHLPVSDGKWINHISASSR